MAKILVLLANGFEEIEAISIIDICRRGGIDVVSAGVESLEVEGAHKITIKADYLLEGLKIDDFDMVVLPGGWGGTKILASSPTVQHLLREMRANNKLIGAICAAPFALHSAGVLGKKYTCYPNIEKQIGAGYCDEKVVIDGLVMTSQGPATVIYFALAIIEKIVGKQTADIVKSSLLA